MSKNKQSNFRINPEAAEKFRQYCESNGWTQAQAFDHVIQVLELDRAKTAVSGRAVEIETFEKHVKDILSAYLNSIELSNNAEARIREQFESALIRKDRTIDDLQEKVKQLLEDKNVNDASMEMVNTISAAAEERAKNAIEQLENMKKTIADQERINAMLTSQLTDATEKLDGYQALKKSEESLKKEVIESKNCITDLERTLSDFKIEAENTLKNTQAQADLAKERAIMVKEREMHELASQLTAATEKLDEYQALKKSEESLKEEVIVLKNRIIDLERKLSNSKIETENALKNAQTQAELIKERAVTAKEREMHELVRETDKENAHLTAKIEQLQAEITRLSKSK